MLEALPSALEPTIWRRLREDDPAARACFAAGVIPILSRFVLEGAPGPFSANLARRGSGDVAHRPSRGSGPFVLDMWADLYAPIGRTYGHRPTEAPRERSPAGSTRSTSSRARSRRRGSAA